MDISQRLAHAAVAHPMSNGKPGRCKATTKAASSWVRDDDRRCGGLGGRANDDVRRRLAEASWLAAVGGSGCCWLPSAGANRRRTTHFGGNPLKGGGTPAIKARPRALLALRARSRLLVAVLDLTPPLPPSPPPQTRVSPSAMGSDAKPACHIRTRKFKGNPLLARRQMVRALIPRSRRDTRCPTPPPPSAPAARSRAASTHTHDACWRV